MEIIVRKNLSLILFKIEKYSRRNSSFFFEFTTIMAFEYFYQKKVDFAIIEVGLGGRLDSTNIIKPLVSAITNVDLDHQNILGETLEEIATEKSRDCKAQYSPLFLATKEIWLKILFNKKASKIILNL